MGTSVIWEKPTYSVCTVFMCVHIPLVLLLSWYATRVTEFPCQIHPDPVQSSWNLEHCGKKMVCEWEEGLFTVTWLVIFLEKSFLAFHPSLATYSQQHMQPRVFHSVFSTGIFPCTFNHLIPQWWVFCCSVGFFLIWFVHFVLLAILHCNFSPSFFPGGTFWFSQKRWINSTLAKPHTSHEQIT